VPAGFCVTTDAFRRIMAGAVDRRPARSPVAAEPDDREAIRTLSAEIRRPIEALAMPHDLAAAITGALAGSASKPPTPCDPARRRRTCRRPPSRASRTRT
jgi:phosphoenolpyruvate synthase/pyruvate phosphate dikinase